MKIFVAVVVSLAVGFLAGSLFVKARTRRPVEAPAPQVKAPPPPSSAPAPLAEIPGPEVEKLQAEVADLKEKLAAKLKVEAKTEPAPAEGPKSDWKERMHAFLKKGVSGYKGEGFAELVAEMKKLGKEGIDALSEQLLNATAAGERFLAGALLEDLDDPAAIPALAQSLQKDDDLLVRRMSSHAIAMIENEAGLSALRAAMSADSDWGVRVNSAYGVAKLGQPDGVRMLEDSYRSPATPAEYKLGVLGALGDVASPTSAPIFRKVLSESTDFSALYVAIGAVQKMNDATFVPELNRIAADAKYASNIREMAKKAAETLGK